MIYRVIQHVSLHSLASTVVVARLARGEQARALGLARATSSAASELREQSAAVSSSKALRLTLTQRADGSEPFMATAVSPLPVHETQSPPPLAVVAADQLALARRLVV